MIEQFCDHGEFSVTHGTHEIGVPLRFTPARVYLSIDSDDFQVCGGALSMGTAVVVERGFVIVVEVKSDTATIRWIAY